MVCVRRGYIADYCNEKPRARPSPQRVIRFRTFIREDFGLGIRCGGGRRGRYIILYSRDDDLSSDLTRWVSSKQGTVEVAVRGAVFVRMEGARGGSGIRL